MNQPKNNPKAGMNRGAKALLASLSITTTLGGWAWLSLTQPPTPVDAANTDQPTTVDATEIPTIQSIGGVGDVNLEPLATPNLPRLADLPLRGLRHVGDATPITIATAVPTQPQSQDPTSQPQQQRNGGGGGGDHSNVSAPPPSHQNQPPPPPPPPKPRKTKSSRP